MKNHSVLLPALALIAVACSSGRSYVTQRDAQGNYVTSSEYQSMDRAEFERAMRDGLADYNRRVDDLRKRANELGGDSLKEFSDYAEELEEKRVKFENEMSRSEATLVDEWADSRERTLDAYYDMRECLDEAYEEVLEEA